MMISKEITFCGHPLILACDAKCRKAWGINRRPRVECSEREDDYALLGDYELGIAPHDPGTYEGCDAKPTRPESRLNKWCARECERHSLIEIGQPIVLNDLTKRFYNYAPHTRE